MHAVMGTGRRIGGRYRLREPIGRGAMGIVWRGRDELLDRDVAVKEVQITSHASPADAEVLYQRTLREARTAARLSHPSVVKVFDVVEEGGTPWIVMEMVEARSLDQVITEDGPLPPEQAAELGTSLVSALANAHSAGVLHRDVKPSNVLVTTDGRAVLTDFGIATFAEDLGLTQAGMVVGTPGFTAPERIRGDVATAASDLWSLGATLYAAVEGRGPFDRVGGSSVISAGVATEDAPRAPSAGPLGPVIDALLSRDPGTRPDATTAARLLASAATAARTGPRPLRDDWPAETSNEPETEETAKAGPGQMSDADSGFLDPPDYEQLQIPDSTQAGQAAASASEPAKDSGGGAAGAVAAGAGAAAAGAVAAAVGAEALGVAAAAGAAGAAGSSGASELATVGPAGTGGRAAVPAAGGGAGAGAAVGSGGGLDPSRGPALWGPVRSQASSATPDAAAPESASPSAPSGPGKAGGGGVTGNGMWDRARQAWNSSGRWRLVVAATGIAAIVVAAIIGWNIFQHSGPASALGTTVPPGAPGQTSGTGSAGHGSGGKKGGHSGSANPSPAGTAGNHGGTPAGHGSSKPSTGPSGSSPGHPSPSSNPTPSGSASPTPTSSASSSPTPTPSTSTSPTTVLPSGWKWHRFGAVLMEAVAGFKIGMPDAWTQSVSGEVAHLTQSARDFHLAVNLAYWAFSKPLREAQYLQTQAAKAHKNDYRVLILSSTGFKAQGGYRSASAAELKYSWYNASEATYYTQLDLLVTLSTIAGSQPYTFELWAPSGTFGSASGIFHTALPTFRPLPS